MYFLINDSINMRKYIFSLFFFVLSVTFAADIDYSKLSPLKIEQDLANCPDRAPNINLSCEELKTFASRINDFAIQMQVDRQGYGKAILASQEKLAKQQELLAKNTNNEELNMEIASSQQEINERLLLIRWLESPR
jgi:hypothetical protein